MTDEIIRYDEAMHHAHAGKQYGCVGPAYADINWLETDEPKPTAASLEAVWNTIKADYNKRILDDTRRMVYPSTHDLVVALWEKLVEVDGLTSTDITALQAKRLQVKTDNPLS